MIYSQLIKKIAGVTHGFTTKNTPLHERNNIDKKVVTLKQVHQDNLVWVNKFEKDVHAADAVAAITPHLPIGVYSADCVPTLIVAQSKSSLRPCGVMAIHGGWRSTAMLLPQKAFEQFVLKIKNTYAGDQHIFFAAIGPCISFSEFEVHEDVVSAFKNSPLKENNLVKFLKNENARDKFLINLSGETTRQLDAVATKQNIDLQIDDLKLCTVVNADLFPSYRRKDQKEMRSVLSFISF